MRLQAPFCPKKETVKWLSCRGKSRQAGNGDIIVGRLKARKLILPSPWRSAGSHRPICLYLITLTIGSFGIVYCEPRQAEEWSRLRETKRNLLARNQDRDFSLLLTRYQLSSCGTVNKGNTLNCKLAPNHTLISG